MSIIHSRHIVTQCGVTPVTASPKVKGHSVTAPLRHYVLKGRHFRHPVTESLPGESSCWIRRERQEQDGRQGSGMNLWRAKRNQMIFGRTSLAWFLLGPTGEAGTLVLG